MTCGPGHRQHRWKKARKADYSVQRGRLGLSMKSSHLATSTGLIHRSITFRSGMFLVQLTMWFMSCGATSHLDSGYQRCHRSYSSKSLAGDSIQFSVVLIGYVQFVAAFVLLLSLVELYLVACCHCSAEYGPCVDGYFLAHFYLCDLIALILFCSLLFFIPAFSLFFLLILGGIETNEPNI